MELGVKLVTLSPPPVSEFLLQIELQLRISTHSGCHTGPAAVLSSHSAYQQSMRAWRAKTEKETKLVFTRTRLNFKSQRQLTATFR